MRHYPVSSISLVPELFLYPVQGFFRSQTEPWLFSWSREAKYSLGRQESTQPQLNVPVTTLTHQIFLCSMCRRFFKKTSRDDMAVAIYSTKSSHLLMWGIIWSASHLLLCTQTFKNYFFLLLYGFKFFSESSTYRIQLKACI